MPNCGPATRRGRSASGEASGGSSGRLELLQSVSFVLRKKWIGRLSEDGPEAALMTQSDSRRAQGSERAGRQQGTLEEQRGAQLGHLGSWRGPLDNGAGSSADRHHPRSPFPPHIHIPQPHISAFTHETPLSLSPLLVSRISASVELLPSIICAAHRRIPSARHCPPCTGSQSASAALVRSQFGKHRHSLDSRTQKKIFQREEDVAWCDETGRWESVMGRQERCWLVKQTVQPNLVLQSWSS